MTGAGICEPRPVRTWTLTTLREGRIKIGTKVVRHAKAVMFQLAEVAVSRALPAAILGRIGRLRVAPAQGERTSRADGSGEESRRMGTSRREVREPDRGTSRRGLAGASGRTSSLPTAPIPSFLL
jgi:hypothetical protein